MPSYYTSAEIEAALPWEYVATAQSAGEYVPVRAAEYEAPSDVASTAPRGVVVAPAHTVAWLARKLRGSMFLSFNEMVRRAFALGFASQGCRLDAAQSARLRAAARQLWDAAPVVAGMPGRLL